MSKKKISLLHLLNARVMKGECYAVIVCSGFEQQFKNFQRHWTIIDQSQLLETY